MDDLSDQRSLYRPSDEHDACGVGFVAHIKGTRSHSIVRQALDLLINLEHRGACGSDPDTGDGAGLVFLPSDLRVQARLRAVVERVAAEEGQRVLGWRPVPTNLSKIGKSAAAVAPAFEQLFVGNLASGFNRTDAGAFERRLYIVRKRIEHEVAQLDLTAHDRKDFYIASLSANTLIYKGMLTATQIEGMFPDLSDPDFESALALVHQRFSTNTFPSWPLAHPYRYVAHNGEINTLRGNANWMKAREGLLESSVFGDELQKVLPVITPGGSDTATFDNVLEFLVMAGRSLPHAVSMMIPEPWAGNHAMDPAIRDFYEYHSSLMEPWDGPASITFTDGTLIGAVLDRNGLRPSRYCITNDDLVIMASEVGVLDIPAENVVRKDRLRPGKMLPIDTGQGRIISDDEIKQTLAAEQPYREWLRHNLVDIENLPNAAAERPDHQTVFCRQQAFGYTQEDLRVLMTPMAQNGEEWIGSMGTDTALAVLSDKPRLLYDYFKQLFAQVTNPPLDAIREELVTSMGGTIGPEGNLLEATPEACRQIKVDFPVLHNDQVAKLRHLPPGSPFRSTTLPLLYHPDDDGPELERAMAELCRKASAAVASGYGILILSDRGVDAKHAPIPSLLATAGVHHHLVREGTRTKCGLLVETGDAREVHHVALLIGYGAGSVNLYLAFETLDDLIRQGLLPNVTHNQAVTKYIKALNKGVLKVMSKMGISTLQSYCGAQIFEAIGLDREFVDKYFLNVAGRALKGVHFAVEFLTQQNRICQGDDVASGLLVPRSLGEGGSRIEPITATGKHVVIIGGGDTGADCLGTAHRQGAASVAQLELLPTPPNQRAADNPWPLWPNIFRTSSAHEESGDRLYAVATTELAGDSGGRVTALHGHKVRRVIADGRVSFEPLPDSAFEMKADLVLLAIGFVGPKKSRLLTDLEVRFSERGNAARDDQWMTNVPGVFTTGDMQRGQSLIVWAIDDGRRAAAAVDAYLAKEI